MPESLTLPRKKHSHRCKICREGTYCYKAQCLLPQRVEACANCQWKQKREAEETAKRLEQVGDRITR